MPRFSGGARPFRKKGELMQGSWLALPLSLVLIAMQGCAAPAQVRQDTSDTSHPSDMVVGMLNLHLAQLNTSLEGYNRQIAQLQHMPETPDPILRELRTLDLAGWQLHQQQFAFQRDHLRFALDQLQRAKTDPGEKAQILDRWVKQEQTYEAAVNDFRQQRYALERKRLELEGELVRRYLR
jgi:hypothetical protein